MKKLEVILRDSFSHCLHTKIVFASEEKHEKLKKIMHNNQNIKQFTNGISFNWNIISIKEI